MRATAPRAEWKSNVIGLTFNLADGSAQSVEAPEGYTAMEAATRNGVPGILAECGGACSCATCHVIVDPDWFARTGEPSDEERDLLTFAFDVQPTSRLSCQIRLAKPLDGLTMTVPPRQN